MTDYEAVIGLEVHAQLATQSKLFCGCTTAFGHAPNENVCPVCLGLPGALPVLNRGAVEMAVRAALALGCRIEPESQFARKNYFYPDLPKGYQISQYDRPFARNGQLVLEVDGQEHSVRIQRVHMEEDAGKNLHGHGGDSLVDLNRAGVPLIEIVSEPDLRSAAQAQAYMRALRDILVSLGVNDGNLEEGSLRCDANVSIRPRGQEQLGTRTELKNLNSFRFLSRAIEIEVARQIALISAGGRVEQETRSFDPDKGTTRSLRGKEEAHDYRYFPEPDLPPLCLPEALVAEQRARVGELPRERTQRYQRELSLPPSAAQTLAQHPKLSQFFEAVLAGGTNPVAAANWIITEVLRTSVLHGAEARFSVTPAQVAELLSLVDAGAISGKQAKEVFAAIEGSDRSPRAVVEERGLRVVGAEEDLLPIIRRLIAEHPAQAEQVRAGKKGLVGFFVGRVMKETGGAADPRLVNQLLMREIG